MQEEIQIESKSVAVDTLSIIREVWLTISL
jgi:hypothetical protein